MGLSIEESSLLKPTPSMTLKRMKIVLQLYNVSSSITLYSWLHDCLLATYLLSTLVSGGLYYFTQRLATATIQLGQHLFHSALKYVGGDLDECSDRRPVECRCYLITEIQYLCWRLATLGRQSCTSFCSRIHLNSSLIHILSVRTDSVIVTSCSDLPVNIVNNPGSSTQLVGSSATFSCAADGTQPLTFMWYKDGESAPLVARGGVSISNRPSESSFTLTSIATSDAGEYYCVASNNLAAGTFTWNSTYATLTVQGKYISCDMLPAHSIRVQSDWSDHSLSH